MTKGFLTGLYVYGPKGCGKSKLRIEGYEHVEFEELRNMTHAAMVAKYNGKQVLIVHV